MNSILGEEKFTDTDQVSPNAEEYVPKTIPLTRKRSKKEQEKLDERQRQLERDARKQETLTEDEIKAKKFLEE
jgi:hypothetical protein